jgi:hypothetical protein
MRQREAEVNSHVRKVLTDQRRNGELFNASMPWGQLPFHGREDATHFQPSANAGFVLAVNVEFLAGTRAEWTAFYGLSSRLPCLWTAATVETTNHDDCRGIEAEIQCVREALQ